MFFNIANEDIKAPFQRGFKDDKIILRFENKVSFETGIKMISKNNENWVDIIVTDLSNHISQEASIYLGYIPNTIQSIIKINLDKIEECTLANTVKKFLRSKRECKIKLLIINGCHSWGLAQIFKKYVKLVICVHPNTAIYDSTCTQFVEQFYQNFSKFSANLGVRGFGFKDIVYLSYLQA